MKVDCIMCQSLGEYGDGGDCPYCGGKGYKEVPDKLTKVRLEYTVSIYVDVDVADWRDIDVAKRIIERQLNDGHLLTMKVEFDGQKIFPHFADVQYYDWDTLEGWGNS